MFFQGGSLSKTEQPSETNLTAERETVEKDAFVDGQSRDAAAVATGAEQSPQNDTLSESQKRFSSERIKCSKGSPAKAESSNTLRPNTGHNGRVRLWVARLESARHFWR